MDFFENQPNLLNENDSSSSNDTAVINFGTAIALAGTIIATFGDALQSIGGIIVFNKTLEINAKESVDENDKKKEIEDMKNQIALQQELLIQQKKQLEEHKKILQRVQRKQ